MNPTREILFNVDPASELALYVLMTLPIGFIAYGLARRVYRWKVGRPENRTDQLLRRVFDVIRMSVFHGRIVRRRNLYGGLMHLCIFAGFITLFVGTLIVMVEADVTVPLMGLSFFHGDFYLGFKFAMNLGGLLLIAGIMMALYRRAALRPATQQSTGDDLLLLGFLLVLAVQGFSLQALRLAHTGEQWAPWAFVSYPLSLALQGLPADLVLSLHKFSWWLHFVTAFAFLAYVAYSKMIHAFTALSSVFFRRLLPRGRLSTIADIETAETIGASKLEHFNWAQLMSLDACMHCGRCLEYCPTFNTGKALRPRDLVLELAGFQADQGGIFSGAPDEASNAGRFRWGRGGSRELIGEVVSEQEIWDCTTCGACMEQCPVSIEHVPFIVDLRRNLVMERNSFPPELAPVFNSLERLGNPYQNIPLERAAWTRKLEQPVAEMKDAVAAGQSIDYLFFVGCLGSFVSRNQKTTLALARILQTAGISFAILGKEETCTGDPAKRMGHEYLAQQLAQKTIERLNFYNVKKIVTACPHCFNAIRNEYPQLGGNYEVIHHSELIAQLLAEGRITLDQSSDLAQQKVTYHDPCYLGRYNQVYDAPRNVIDQVPGAQLTEMPRNRKQSFCCGGGGGRAMMKEDTGSRINLERVREALQTRAPVVAAACPFCMGMLEDGIGTANASTELRVLDIAELVAESLQTAAPTAPSPAVTAGA